MTFICEHSTTCVWYPVTYLQYKLYILLKVLLYVPQREFIQNTIHISHNELILLGNPRVVMPRFS